MEEYTRQPLEDAFSALYAIKMLRAMAELEQGE